MTDFRSPIRAVDVVDLIHELRAWNDSDTGREFWKFLRSTPQDREGDPTVSALDQGVFERRPGWPDMADAELFYVTDQMMSVAYEAARTLPDFAVELEDLPAPAGVLLAERGLPFEVADTAVGFAWQRVSWPGGHEGLVLGYLSEREAVIAKALADGDADERAGQVWRESLPRLYEHSGFGVWLFGQPEVADLPADGSVHLALVVKSLWLLMGQRIAVEEPLVYTRTDRKRLERRGVDPAAVRVVKLRRPVVTSGQPAGGAVDWQHQWVVGGHWRQQWYPSRQVHRPRWIAPHVKGPEGKPLIGVDRVHALVR